MGQAIDIFRLSGKKYPIYILASTFSTVSLGTFTFGFSRFLPFRDSFILFYSSKHILDFY
jgi:hypothetical protein